MQKTTLALIIAALLLVGCTAPPNDEGDEEEEPPTNVEPPPPPGPVSLEVRTTGTTLILIDDLGFDPASLQAASGATVTLTLHNDDLAGPHGWTLEGLDGAATGNIDAGESGGVTFVAPAAGTYTFFCPVGDHRARGQEGTFTVT